MFNTLFTIHCFIMTVSQQIQSKINSFPKGTIFTYWKLNIDEANKQAAVKSIERLIRSEVIVRISKGKFYRPDKSVFGLVPPNSIELIKTYTYKNNKRVAYETGNSLYNKLGLTTQVPTFIYLGVYNSRINVNKDNLKIKSVKSYIVPTDNNIKYLQFLDILKDFKTIPDLDINYTIEYLSKQLNSLDLKLLTKYAINYPPRVIAFLGALLEYNKLSIANLKKYLNTTSSFNFGINNDILPTAKKWNIK